MPWLWTWLALGLLATAVVGLGLRLLPWLSASTRSVVWAALLCAIPAFGLLLAAGAPHLLAGDVLVIPQMSAADAAQAMQGGPGANALATAWEAVAVEPPVTDGTRSTGTRTVAYMTSGVLLAWAGAAFVGFVRLATGLVTLRRWRARCRPLPPAALDHLPAWSALQHTGRRASVAWSPDVTTPCVLGLRAPIIALPYGARALAPAALDAILVHELAHVRRRDDVAQFVQHLLRACAAVHPAVWWIDRQLTVEREAACDDWAVTLAAGPRDYARCLVALASRGTGMEALQVAVRGGRSQLAARVHRLVDGRRARRLHAGGLVLSAVPAGVAGATAAALMWLAPPVVLTMPSAPEVQESAVLPRTALATRHDAARHDAARHASLPVTSPDVASGAASYAPSLPASRLPSLPAALAQPPARYLARSAGASLPQSVLVPSPVPSLEPSSSVPSSLVPVPAPRFAALPAALEQGSVAALPAPSTLPAAQDGEAASTGTSAGAPFLEAGMVLGDAGVAVGRAGVAVGGAGRDAGRDAGRGIGRGGVATAGFFTRIGRRVADAF